MPKNSQIEIVYETNSIRTCIATTEDSYHHGHCRIGGLSQRPSINPLLRKLTPFYTFKFPTVITKPNFLQSSAMLSILWFPLRHSNWPPVTCPMCLHYMLSSIFFSLLVSTRILVLLSSIFLMLYLIFSVLLLK